MRSTHVYKHITPLDLLYERIPHLNISAASAVSDQPSPPTATRLNVNNFSKAVAPSSCKSCVNGAQSGDGQELPAHENVNTCAPTMQHQNEVLGQNAAKAKIYLCLQRFKDINKAWAVFFFSVSRLSKTPLQSAVLFLLILSNSVGIPPRNRDEQMQGEPH